jgi:hypothetical protein
LLIKKIKKTHFLHNVAPFFYQFLTFLCKNFTVYRIMQKISHFHDFLLFLHTKISFFSPNSNLFTPFSPTSQAQHKKNAPEHPKIRHFWSLRHTPTAPQVLVIPGTFPLWRRRFSCAKKTWTQQALCSILLHSIEKMIDLVNSYWWIFVVFGALISDWIDEFCWE